MKRGKLFLSVARVLAILVGVLTVPSFLHAQTAAINGTVTDQTGAVVPHAKVTALNEDASFGQSTAEVGRNDGTTGARQLQFGMKFHF